MEVSDPMSEKLEESPASLHMGRDVQGIRGENEVASVVLDDGVELSVKGVFVELGAGGAVSLAGALGVALDSKSMQ